jgi:hypothetical protein
VTAAAWRQTDEFQHNMAQQHQQRLHQLRAVRCNSLDDQITGVIIGNVMWRKLDHQPAPSTVAAS